VTEVEIFKESLDVSRIVMIITIIMTIISVTFSALTLAFQRSHNKKSVKPLCDGSLIINENGVLCVLKNAGLGPMILTKINIITENDRIVKVNQYLNEIYGNKDCNEDKKNNLKVIAVNEEKSVIEIQKNRFENVEKYNDIIKEINKSKIEIIYNDIYDKEYSVMV